MGVCRSGEFRGGESSAVAGRRNSALYRRARLRKGHAKAVGAVAAWYSAGAPFHVLSRQQERRDPAAVVGRIGEVATRRCHKPLDGRMNATHLQVGSCPSDGGEILGKNTPIIGVYA